MPSVDALAAAVAVARESLRSVSATLAHARREGEDLAQALERCGIEGHAQRTRSVASKLETQQATAAGLDTAVNQIQAAVEALRGPDTGAPPDTPPITGSPPEPNPSRGQRDSARFANVTHPRFPPDPTRGPGGTPTELKGNAKGQEDLRRENEAAKILAAAGYDIEQNPALTSSDKNPDYLIQGEVWDCYSPRGNSTRTIHTAIREKVGRGGEDQQADRIILNLDGCGASPTEIRSRLERSPIRRLREIKIVKDDNVTQFYPWDSEVDSHGD